MNEFSTPQSPIIEIFPCLTGDDVINNGAQHLLTELRLLISAPAVIYQKLYVPVLYRFAEFCQAMPLNQNSAPYSLLLRQLTQSIAALKVRRGLLLPPNESAETIAKEEAQWTFAVFTAALLYPLPALLSNKQVNLYQKKQNGNHHPWNPLEGSFYSRAAYYSIEWISPPQISWVAFMEVLIPQLMAPPALHWLKQNTRLFNRWWQAITVEQSGNTLSSIVEKAIQLLNSVPDDTTSATLPIDTVRPQNNLAIEQATSDVCTENSENSTNSQDNDIKITLELLFKFLDELIPNSQSLDWLRVAEGLLINKNTLYRFLKQYRESETLEHFINVIKSALYTHDNRYEFRYRHIVYENRRRVDGIILKEEVLPEHWKNQARTTDFKLVTMRKE